MEFALGALAGLIFGGGTLWLAYEAYKKDAAWAVAILMFAPFVARAFARRYPEGRLPAAVTYAGLLFAVILLLLFGL